jgi:DNA-3-methyladenine glycosylase II
MASRISTDFHIPHFSFEECAWYVHRGFYDCLHTVSNNTITKAIPAGPGHTLVDLTGNGNRLNIHYEQQHESEVLSYVREWFDLDRDLEEFEVQALRMPDFAPVYKAYKGLRLIRIPDLFEAISWSIIGQQINLAFAYTLKSRLVQAYGRKVDDVHYVFPKPEIIAGIEPEDLLPMQFSRRKAEYLIGMAKAMISGSLSKAAVQSLPTTKAMQDYLCRFRGIGPWSANYVLLRSLGRTDAIPYGDAGMINAYKKIFTLQSKPTSEEICHYLDRFPGWQAYVVLFWWRHLSDI